MNNDWWEEYLRQVYNQETEETDERLIKLYLQTARRLKRDIEELYNKFDKRPEEIIMNDLYKNNQYYHFLNSVNKELRKLGEKEIQIMDEELLKVYEMTSKTVSNQIGFQQTFELPAQRVIHSIWCKDGKD